VSKLYMNIYSKVKFPSKFAQTIFMGSNSQAYALQLLSNLNIVIRKKRE
jgi:hypothetical protein